MLVIVKLAALKQNYDKLSLRLENIFPMGRNPY